LSKVKSVFFCNNCGASSPKWLGKCPSCGEWNTYVEEKVSKQSSGSTKSYIRESEKSQAVQVQQIEESNLPRIELNDKELNRVLGGGLVRGSVILFGGEPGIGKSTLMLQIALQQSNLKTLYVSGEESQHQVKMRAQRIGIQNQECYVLAETSVERIKEVIDEMMPQLIIADSIQTLHTDKIESTPGSVSQVKECAGELLKISKEKGIPVFLIGHITKEGMLAGPKILEHMVDTVLQFDGERNFTYRLLRTTKNRFGSTNELGIYEMTGKGLREVADPSEILITQRDTPVSGVALGCSIEGMRPLMIEVQALVSSAAYGTPQRSATGYDLRRLNMLLAVLEKRCGFRLAIKDVFINLAGGIKVEDPGIDLAVICAVLSSGEDIPIRSGVCFAAEIGLTGEIRPVQRLDQRMAEAERLGYKEIFISGLGKSSPELLKSKSLKVHQVSKIEEVFHLLFG
jgi:DNA repair protein RadA/Sms